MLGGMRKKPRNKLGGAWSVPIEVAHHAPRPKLRRVVVPAQPLVKPLLPARDVHIYP